MKILITCPAWTIPHGGIRIILEWANRLTQWHDVYLYNAKGQMRCAWFNISPNVKVVNSFPKGMDCMIITSPHTIDLQNYARAPKKIFIFLQMMEHMFQPLDNTEWMKKCIEFYTTKHPMICISDWNFKMLAEGFGRTAPTYIVGNGVNLNHFPIRVKNRDNRTILVEGWEASNPSKDPDAISPRVAQRLKRYGYKIIAYSGTQLSRYVEVPDEHWVRPDLTRMNDLYERATILLKASKFDARACAPMEAMTKGTVTARAIIMGDDDLQNGINCVRCGYNEDDLFSCALALLDDHQRRLKLAAHGYLHLQANSWEHWMNKINDIITA